MAHSKYYMHVIVVPASIIVIIVVTIVVFDISSGGRMPSLTKVVVDGVVKGR